MRRICSAALAMLLALALLITACTSDALRILTATSLEAAQSLATERSGVIVVEFWKHN